MADEKDKAILKKKIYDLIGLNNYIKRLKTMRLQLLKRLILLIKLINKSQSLMLRLIIYKENLLMLKTKKIKFFKINRDIKKFNFKSTFYSMN